MNVQTTDWPGGPIFGRWYNIEPAVIAAGEGTLKRGQVMAKADDGKWYKYVRETNLAAANSNGNRGTFDNLLGFASSVSIYRAPLKYGRIVPGTVSIKSSADANNSHRLTDDGYGRLKGVEADKQIGFVDYPAGYVHFEWVTNVEVGQMLISYRYRDQDGKSIPRGILTDNEVDATNETSGSVVVIGEVRKDDLIWPAGISAAETARAIALLEDRHIYAV